ncbi:AAA family ATPase [Gordonia sp. HNM0687]|uniref:AAA family ATPase n=1 Tax=Gordonia mangrovi TaxID=2665643 RepID=A0A6L7GT32_9ACTN|nr:AAA family ATPase [Gordonia mangrovi]MXP23184.1 AAA family ATPase [Gordonia mangrovi]UVF77458.1 AAA family ATPase [Gordonia mangrovi]
MRIHRMRLRDYRGVADRDIRFAERGVTVVEGANEAGKSSMIEALELLIDTRADSKAAKVRAIMPAGRDVGTEVEAEISCGAWHFTYFKRFNRQPATSLSVHTPSPEHVTGRDAHERAMEILGQHADLTLFRALRLLQSDEAAGRPVGDSAALARALDRASESVDAAADSAATVEEQALIDAAEAEYRRYRTAGHGRPTGELAAALRDVDELEERCHTLSAARDSVDADARRLRHLLDRRSELARTRELREVERDELAVSWSEIERLQSEISAAGVEARHLLAVSQLAQRDLADRDRVATQIAAATADTERLDGDIATRDALAEQAEASAQQLDDELRAVRDRWQTARTALSAAQVAQRIRDHRRALHDLDERLTELDRIATDSSVVDESLRGNTVDAQAVRTAVDLARRRAVAQARLEAVTARLTVEPTGAVPVTVDGEIVAATTDRVAVTDTVIEVAGVVAVTVRPGADAAGPADELATVDNDIAAFCRRHDLAVLDDHAQRARERADLVERQSGLQRRTRELIGDRGHRAMLDERDELRALLAEEPAGPDPEPDDIASLAATERELAESVMSAERAVTEQHSAAREARARARMGREQRDHLAEQLADLRTRRADLCAALTDDDARRTVEAAAGRLHDARDRLARLEAQLARLDVAEIGFRRDRVAADLAALAREHADLERTSTELRTRIELYRDESRLDILQDASAELEAAKALRDRVQRRADAAELLYRTLVDKRRQARTRYADPFARRLEELGAHVFGEGVRFDVDDNLDVVSRTVDGVTIGHEALSGGAREQLALLTRLACATLVDEADGVPVLVDDALGYSDPRRIAAMAQVLTAAGRDAQVIVLTCSPDRYRGVDDAEIVAV